MQNKSIKSTKNNHIIDIRNDNSYNILYIDDNKIENNILLQNKLNAENYNEPHIKDNSIERKEYNIKLTKVIIFVPNNNIIVNKESNIINKIRNKWN